MRGCEVWKAEKIADIVMAVVLAASCVYLEYRVNELESRISTIESNQMVIVSNIK